MGRPDPYPAMERILDILMMFGDAPDALTMQAVSAAFGGSRSSTYRYLQALRKRGLIEEMAIPGHFRLGPAALALGRRARAAPSLAAIAEPAMRSLVASTRESVLLTRREGDRVGIVAALDSPQALRVATDAARDRPLPVGSFGKVHLAFLSEAARATLPGGDAVDGAALAAIRRQGFARSDSEVEPGMSSLSVPVLTGDDALLAVLTLAAPSFRLAKPVARRLLGALHDAARRIAEGWERAARDEPAPPRPRRAAR